jgi:hypothetical protein
MKQPVQNVSPRLFAQAKSMRKVLAFALLLALLNLPVLSQSSSTPGYLDTSFGDGGRVLDPSSPRVSSSSVAVQADGKVVVAGTGRSIEPSLSRGVWYLPAR